MLHYILTGRSNFLAGPRKAPHESSHLTLSNNANKRIFQNVKLFIRACSLTRFNLTLIQSRYFFQNKSLSCRDRELSRHLESINQQKHCLEEYSNSRCELPKRSLYFFKSLKTLLGVWKMRCEKCFLSVAECRSFCMCVRLCNDYPWYVNCPSTRSSMCKRAVFVGLCVSPRALLHMCVGWWIVCLFAGMQWQELLSVTSWGFPHFK